MRKLTTEQFIEKAQKLKSHDYNRGLVNYLIIN